MESPTWQESLPSNRMRAIRELTQGQEWTNKLREALWCSENADSDPTLIGEVVLQILGIFEKTVSILGSGTDRFNEFEPREHTSDLHSSGSLDEHISENSKDSSKTAIAVEKKKRCAKRRKNSWSSTKVTSVLIDDGHAWRKYGQKDIINAKHQRSYYRCAYKFDQGCLATKQVQKIEDKPPNYKITYFRNHTCNNLQRAPPIILDSPDPRDKSIILNFETRELIEKKQLGPYIPTMKQELMDVFPSLGKLPCNYNDPSWDPYTHVSHVPNESLSLMSSWMDHEEMRILAPAYSSLEQS